MGWGERSVEGLVCSDWRQSRPGVGLTVSGTKQSLVCLTARLHRLPVSFGLRSCRVAGCRYPFKRRSNVSNLAS